MKRRTIATMCAGLVLQLCSATVGAQPSTQGQPAVSQAGAPGSATSASQQEPGRSDALAALQDARTTLARLTEASLSHDAREALATVSTNFRTLYKAYTGEEPTPRRTAMQATGKPSPDWGTALDTLSGSVGSVLNRAGAGASTVGTSGTAQGQPSGALELTTPARQDFEALRSQLQRFATVAGHTSPTGK